VIRHPVIFDADDPPAKAATLDAALTLFVRNGIDSTSIRDIAAESGFTNPAIFKHFESKTEMALCLFERCYMWMTQKLLAAEQALGDAEPVERILAVASCALQLIEDDVDAVLMAQDHLRRFWRMTSPIVRRTTLLGRIRKLTAEIVAAHADDNGPASPRLLASAIAGLLGQVAREYYFGEFEGPASALEPQVRLILQKLLR
jgi:TetR/AcrR family transcriptional regulator, repressor of fatR-cypB operon